MISIFIRIYTSIHKKVVQWRNIQCLRRVPSLFKVQQGWNKVKQFVDLKTDCLSCFSCFRREKVIWKSNSTTKSIRKEITLRHPSSVNQISLVHNHDKTGNKYYTQDNTNTRENPSYGEHWTIEWSHTCELNLKWDILDY